MKEFDRMLDRYGKHLNVVSETIRKLEKQIRHIIFPVELKVSLESGDFWLRWNPDNKRIEYYDSVICTKRLIETKLEIREKVYPYLDQFKSLIVEKLKETYVFDEYGMEDEDESK